MPVISLAWGVDQKLSVSWTGVYEDVTRAQSIVSAVQLELKSVFWAALLRASVYQCDEMAMAYLL